MKLKRKCMTSFLNFANVFIKMTFYMKKFYIILFFIVACVNSKSSYSSFFQDEERQKIKNLQSQIRDIPICNKKAIFLDCFLVLTSDKVNGRINLANQAGYELENIQYPTDVESIQTAFHDS